MVVKITLLLIIFEVNFSNENKTISSIELYPQLDFKLPTTQNPYLWDKEMEVNYLNGLQHWRTQPLTVFLIPFSHNDAGWINTFEEYFDRSSRNILDLVAKLLPSLDKFTFVWSEICFLERWWSRAESLSRKYMQHMVKTGQLEIVTGAWVMPDEATTTVFALLDQLIEGHQWVYSKLGVQVETSWSIDQFGVGSTWPYILSQSGVKLTLAQRVHWAWKRHLAKKRTLDMVWKKDDEDCSGDIRLRVQPTTSYSVTSSCGPDKNICSQFDFNPDISQAFPIKFQNIRQRVETLMGQYGRLGSVSENNVALVTLGTDFRFENHSEWVSQYFNYKAIMEYINSNFDLYHTRMHFSTLKDYMLQTRAPDVSFIGDFFVYSDLGPDNIVQGDYWSGYFSTRPYWKLLGRKLESVLRTAEIIYSFCHVKKLKCTPSDIVSQEMESAYSKLVYARRALGLFQHHDAITGTSTAKVMTDFERKLKRAIRYTKQVEALGVSLIATSFQEPAGFTRVSRDRVINKFPAIVSIFNSLMATRVEVISLRVSRTDLSVFDSRTGLFVPHQINFCNLSEDFELVFLPTLYALTLSNFIISVETTGVQKLSKVYKLVQQEANFSFTIKTSRQSLIFNSDSGMLTGILSAEGDHVLVDIAVKAYESDPTRSGAYLFRPKPGTLKLNTTITSKNIYVLEGPLYKDVVTNYGDTFSIRTRAYEYGNLANVVEITTVTDFGPKIENINLEIFLKVTTDMKYTQFYTDVNGFNYRERITLDALEVGGNYYPMTEEVYLDNEESRLTILADHSHGVASLIPGEIEIMLDRRILLDDLRGMGEGVFDERRGKSRFLLYFSDPTSAKEKSHLLALQLNNEAPAFIPREGLNAEPHTLVSQQLPPNIHILNIKTLPNKDGTASNALLMILFRKYSLPSYSSTNAFYNNTVFNELSPQIISRTLLTGVGEFESYIGLNEVQIKPFSLNALKLFF